MIIHECKAIHIHIPKTAGVALEHAIMTEILGYDTSGEIGHLSDDLKIRFDLRGKQKHKQAKYYVLDNDIAQSQWDEYYKFAIVRNPWDRVVSEFHWRHSLPSRHPSTDFKEFINYCEFRIKDIKNKKRDIYWAHAQTQFSYITNNNKIIIDDIFKFEELSKATQIISDKLQLSLKLKKHNASKHNHYREYYDQKTKLMVYNLYKEDIEAFGYEF